MTNQEVDLSLIPLRKLGLACKEFAGNEGAYQVIMDEVSLRCQLFLHLFDRGDEKEVVASLNIALAQAGFIIEVDHLSKSAVVRHVDTRPKPLIKRAVSGPYGMTL